MITAARQRRLSSSCAMAPRHFRTTSNAPTRRASSASTNCRLRSPSSTSCRARRSANSPATSCAKHNHHSSRSKPNNSNSNRRSPMTDAVIVSTARTPIGKAYRGALNATEGAPLLGHAIGEAVARAKIDPNEIEDVVKGAALQQGATGGNIARKALLRAGLPVTAGGTTIDRQCASGLQAIALAARSVIFDGVEIAVGGGGESISLVQNDKMNGFHAQDPALLEI